VTSPLVLKLGGELLESAGQRARIAAACAALAARRPLVVVHGGGRAIDAELDRRGIAPRKVDGLRVTDAETLDVVVSVLAGNANTDLVAALVGQGVSAVGLTGVDAGIGRARAAAAHRTATGAIVDLGLVGDPAGADTSLVSLLLVHGYVPVIASLGVEAADGAGKPGGGPPRVLNVNADVMACRVAAGLPGSELVIAGTTPGVLDARGDLLPALDAETIDALIDGGTATAGMIAKLSACRQALLDGVARVRIVDGRTLDGAHGVDSATGTTISLTAVATGS
jgi:acetylglutamate kinase